MYVIIVMFHERFPRILATFATVFKNRWLPPVQLVYPHSVFFLNVVAEVHSLNRYSKGKRVYYGYSYG